MINLEIRSYRRPGSDESEQIEFGDIIHKHDISLGEALELVIGKMIEYTSNVGTTIQRARSIYTAEEDMEVALSHEYYVGPWPPQNMRAVPENWYGYWYSFTPKWVDLEGSIPELMTLYKAVVVYFQHFKNSGAYLYASPEFRRHIERGELGHKPHSAAQVTK